MATDRVEIESHLAHCLKLYQDQSLNPSPDSKNRATLHCKTAIIELHGWIESTLEDICLVFVNNPTSPKELRKVAQEKSRKIKKNNGIGYHSHISRLFHLTFGSKLAQELECKLSLTGDFSADLETIKELRNQLAHSYIRHSSTIPSNMAPDYLITLYLPRIADKLDEIKFHVGIYGSDADKRDGQIPCHNP